VANTSGQTIPTARFAGSATRRAPIASNRRRRIAGEISRYLGAVSILVVGAAVVGAVLFAPVRLLGERLGDLILSLAALGAIGIALGTLVSLLISEYMPLFGFMESGYRLAIVLTLVFDGLTTVFLGVFLVIVGPQLRTAITTKRRTR
jgi:hypothetical protein